MSEHHTEAANMPGANSGPDRSGQGRERGTETGASYQAPAGDQGYEGTHRPWSAEPHPWPGQGAHPGYQSAPPYPYPHPYPPPGYHPPATAPYWSGAMPPPGYAQAAPHHGQAGHSGPAGTGQGHGARVSDLINEVASGGSGLSSLTRMLDLDDMDFWKGALVGAAAVLLLTNGSVQSALFGAAVKTGKTDGAA